MRVHGVKPHWGWLFLLVGLVTWFISCEALSWRQVLEMSSPSHLEIGDVHVFPCRKGFWRAVATLSLFHSAGHRLPSSDYGRPAYLEPPTSFRIVPSIAYSEVWQATSWATAASSVGWVGGVIRVRDVPWSQVNPWVLYLSVQSFRVVPEGYFIGTVLSGSLTAKDAIYICNVRLFTVTWSPNQCRAVFET